MPDMPEPSLARIPTGANFVSAAGATAAMRSAMIARTMDSRCVTVSPLSPPAAMRLDFTSDMTTPSMNSMSGGLSMRPTMRLTILNAVSLLRELVTQAQPMGNAAPDRYSASIMKSIETATPMRLMIMTPNTMMPTIAPPTTEVAEVPEINPARLPPSDAMPPSLPPPHWMRPSHNAPTQAPTTLPIHGPMMTPRKNFGMEPMMVVSISSAPRSPLR